MLFKFERTENSVGTSDGLCAAMACDASGCGLLVEKDSDTISVAQSDAARDLVRNAFDGMKASFSGGDAAEEGGDGPATVAEEGQPKYQYPLWQWLSIFSIAITFSIVGVATSLISRKRTIFGLKMDWHLSSLFAIYFFSALSGILVVGLFAGGFLQGNLFPNFTGDEYNFGFNSWSALKFRGQDWFKLAIWAYISGFYERFMPQIFDRLIKESHEVAPRGGEPAGA